MIEEYKDIKRSAIAAIHQNRTWRGVR